jgi:hypothetical protein
MAESPLSAGDPAILGVICPKRAGFDVQGGIGDWGRVTRGCDANSSPPGLSTRLTNLAPPELRRARRNWAARVSCQARRMRFFVTSGRDPRSGRAANSCRWAIGKTGALPRVLASCCFSIEGVVSSWAVRSLAEHDIAEVGSVH